MEKVKTFIKLKRNLIVKTMKFECEDVENFYDVVRPFYNIAKFFGYSPFTLPKDTSWTKQQSTPWNMLISVFSFALYFFLLYIQLSTDKLYSHGIVVIDVAEDILLAYLTCTSIFSTTILLILRKHVWVLIKDIVSVDDKVNFHSTF